MSQTNKRARKENRRENRIRCCSLSPVFFTILDKQYETMNQTLSDFKLVASNDGNHFQQYETCQQQSKCYLLAPPPRPPTIPELFLTTTCRLSSSGSSSTFTNIRSRADSSSLTIISIVLGILIAFTSTCLILVLLGVK